MTVATRITVDGTEYDNYKRLDVSRSISDYTATSNFQVLFDSPFGRYKSDFRVGQEIVVYVTPTGQAEQTLFSGVIEKVQHEGDGKKQTARISGKDYSLRIYDSTVKPVVYTNTEASAIVTALIEDNVDGVTTNNVQATGVNIQRISFNHSPVNEAIKQLAELAGYIFYVDENRDLHFEPRNNEDSGIVIDSSNTLKARRDITREGMYNNIYVYGNRALTGYQETFGYDGTGSVFTLINKPRNTFVTVDGTPQNGGVLELSSIPQSGVDYLVSYNDKKIVFVSGTDIGYSAIPSSGASVVVNYDREIPIVKYGLNRESIQLYGQKDKIITDNSINDPQTASAILKKELDAADPFKGVVVDIKGWYDITPGNTARVTIPDYDIDESVGILNVQYKFNRETVNTEHIINIRLDKKIKDITDEITDLRNRLNKLEALERKESDTLTRLEQTNRGFSIVNKYWQIATRSYTGSTLILSDNKLTYEQTLASGTNQNVLAGSATGLGSPYGPLNIIKSGGYW